MKKLVFMSALVLGIIFITGKSTAQSIQSTEKATKVETTQTGQQAQGNFVDKNGDGICDKCKGNKNCVQGSCCGEGMEKGNCEGMKKGNCCSKGKGHQNHHGQQNCQKETAPQPEKK